MKLREYPFIGIGKKRGFIYTQLKQTEKAFLFEVRSGEKFHYVVFLRKVNVGRMHFAYPSSRDFGDWAWVYLTYESAVAEFNLLSTYDGQSET